MNGFNWTLKATGANALVVLSFSDHFVKCEVVNSSNTILYSLQKTVIQSFCSGFAYKLAQNKNSGEIASTINVYPNPTEKDVTLEFTSNDKTYLETQIYNVSGQLVIQNKYPIKIGLNSIKLNLDLKQGIYTIRANNTESVYTKKIVIN